MTEKGFTVTNNVYVPDRVKPDSVFERDYITLRWKEKRIYSDAELMQLPEISDEHPCYAEWQLRRQSAERLKEYIAAKSAPQKILEIGCGNGWLSHLMAKIPRTRVTGCDINFTELQQAARVFGHLPNLRFVYGSVNTEIFGDVQYDCIVCAASIQYFPCLHALMQDILPLLKPGGEIHIVDSPFYAPEEKAEAYERSKAYYTSLGFPEMAKQYFHHTHDELTAFNPTMLYKPSRWKKIFSRQVNPFPWIRIVRPGHAA